MSNDRFKVVSNSKELLDFMDKILVNFPRKEFVLKDRLETTSYDILELIYLANVHEDRINIQKQILCKISMMDFYLQRSYHKKCISEKLLMSGCRKLESITKMLYGWINSDGCLSK